MVADKVWDAFCRDIPARDQDSVLTMIAEAVSGWGEHKCITILDRQKYDAVNAHASGILTWGDQEYSFHAEDGNWNGTRLLSWEEVGEEFEHHKPTTLALQPTLTHISKALERGEYGCKVLLLKWHNLVHREPLASLPGKYSYDRMMQPGVVVEKYWREQAAESGLEIVPDYEAAETIKRLESEILDAQWRSPWANKVSEIKGAG